MLDKLVSVMLQGVPPERKQILKQPPSKYSAKYDKFYLVKDPSGRKRYSCLLLDEAVAYTSFIYSRTAKNGSPVLCSISEVARG